MAKNYNIAPYYDDFDETKGFLRILFNPGRAVQARELTQLQTILSNQVSRFANHIFADGSKVFGGKIELDKNVEHIVIQTGSFGGGATNASDFVGKYIKGVSGGSDTGAQAYVHKADDATRKIFFSYRGGTFSATDQIQVVDLDSEGVPIYTGIVESVGAATFASCSPGIIYIGGNFVLLSEQTILVDPSSNAGDWLIGFSVSETEVTYSGDSTLVDPAQGSYNQNAPGADRYKVILTLDSYAPGSEPVDGTFYPKTIIEDGVIIQEEKNTEYSDILDLLAQRTYEESGDYTVNPFLIKMEDHGTDVTKLNAVLDPGIAYVKGYRHETVSKTTLEINKGREYLETTETTYHGYSPYIKLDRDSIEGLPAIGNMEWINFYPTDATDSANWKSTGVPAGTTQPIGNARVVGLIFTGIEYRLYITEYESISGDMATVKGVGADDDTFHASTILEGSDSFNDDYTILYSENGNRVNMIRFQREALKSHDTTNFVQRVQRQASAVVSGSQSTITVSGATIDQEESPIVIDLATGAVLVPNQDYNTVGTSGGNLVLNFTMDVDPANVAVHFYVIITGGSRKSKTNTNKTDTLSQADSSGKLMLAESDVITITKIIEDPNGDTTGPTVIFDAGVGDDADDLNWNNGQKDFYYDYAYIEGLTANEYYTVEYNYYIHSGSGNYFDVQSYTDISVIERYVTSTGENIFLGDVLDFRRKIQDLSSGVYIPTPNSYATMNYEYYLPRRDLIYIDKDGNFGVIEGVSSLNPGTPEETSNSMVLYVLYIPAYTYDKKDVITSYIENKNYTMRDIGELERRIDNLEYYTSLNMLEQAAQNFEITDENGFNRFKNGILVDNFIGANVVDVEDPEYFCAIDPDNGTLRPAFALKDIALQRDDSVHSVSSNGDGTESDATYNVRFHANTATVEYSVVPFITQDKASQYMNVNPYNVFAWDGDVTLTPNTDYWIDTEYLPDLVTNIDGLYDDLIQKTISAYGTRWGSWRTLWTGTRTVKGREVDHTRAHSTGQVRTVTSVITTSSQIRTGTMLVARPNRITQNLGERVVDVSVIPYMRSIAVAFEAKNLKPNTDLKAFFDDRDVNAYVTADSGYEPNDAVNFCIRTNSAGKVKGVYTIPSNDTMRFRTGQKPFTLIDDTFHPTTSAEANFLAAGHLQKKQRSILSISKPEITTVTITGSRTVSSTRSSFGAWYDPVAQSFLINQEGGVFLKNIELFFASKDANLPVSIQIVETENGYPGSSVVPFSRVSLEPADVNISNDSSVGTTFTFSDPVYLQNNQEYAFIVYSNSDNYNIWYGEIGAFDIQQLPDEIRIAEQPYAGVLFKSQNGSTWTADQTKDLKFTINRCKFETKTGDSTEADVFYIDDLSLLEGNPAQHVDVFATNCQYEIDNLVFDLTSLKFGYKFDGYSLWKDEINGEEISLPAQVHVTNDVDVIYGGAKNAVVQAHMFTENEYVSPVLSMDRCHVVMVNNTVYGWNSEPYENIYNPGATDPTVDANDYYDAGVYVTRPTTLLNPSDDIKVILDVLKQGGSDVQLFFSTGKFSPKYVEIVDTAVNGRTVAEARTELAGDLVYLYGLSGTNTATYLTKMTCTSVDNEPTVPRVYVTGINDPTKFAYQSDWASQTPTAFTEMFVTTEINTDLNGKVVADWSNATDYDGVSATVYVWHAGYLWKSTEQTGPSYSGPVEPSLYGITWTRISYNRTCANGSAGEEVKTDTERKWRKMDIESQERDDSFATTNFIEYVFKPAGIVEEEFTTFQVKIQLLAPKEADDTLAPTLVPMCSGLRVIATY